MQGRGKDLSNLGLGREEGNTSSAICEKGIFSVSDLEVNPSDDSVLFPLSALPHFIFPFHSLLIQNNYNDL